MTNNCEIMKILLQNHWSGRKYTKKVPKFFLIFFLDFFFLPFLPALNTGSPCTELFTQKYSYLKQDDI